ncbi:MAG: LysM peptidoglycan-binding domain-containing protein [Candidatus Sungbacteria bacterium]|nr:LysM peptidoglycan-binding domain-containing protein [Candidatus Sungbacteria bacterium]
MFPKNRIHLSRNLSAQTTPYPEARKWLKRTVWLLVIVLGLGIYYFAKPPGHPTGRPGEYPGEPKQILGEQQAAPQTEYLIYEVKKGDTLFNLSSRFGVSWQTLAQINNLEEPYILKIGQEIKIPQ